MTQPSGKPLPAELRTRMERAFGHDFSNVRCHPGSHRPSTVNANAFAFGDDIFFRPGHYDPTTSKGQELIAHELAHVVQQRKREHITPTLQGRAQAKMAVDKLVKLWKLKP